MSKFCGPSGPTLPILNKDNSELITTKQRFEFLNKIFSIASKVLRVS